MQPPVQNRQNEPSAVLTQDGHLLASIASPGASPAATSGTTSAPRPPLRASASDPEQSLAIPFEQLSLYDQDQIRRRQQQDRQIVDHTTHAPNNPFVGSDLERETQYVDESSMLRQRLGQDAKGKAPDHGYASAAPSRPRPASRTTTPAGPKPQRPDLPHRNSSFKRHASFDSPREVPLPYMPHSHMHHLSYSQTQQHDVPPFPHVMGDGVEVAAQASPPLFMPYDRPSPVVIAPATSASDHHGSTPASTSSSESSLSTSSLSSSQASMSRVDTPMDTGGSLPTASGTNPYFAGAVPGLSSASASASASSSVFSQMQQTYSPGVGKAPQAGPVPLFARPCSTPDASSPMAPPPPRIHSPHPVRAATGMPDRTSTVSLPLPAHTPYHTLPSAEGNTASAVSSSASRPPPLEYHSSSSSSGISLPTPPSSYSASPAVPNPPRMPARARHSDPFDRASSPPLGRLLERVYAATEASSTGPATTFMDREALRERREAPPPRITPENLPPPAPPQVLTPPPPPVSEEGQGQRPYEPFLAHALPSNDAWIAVETVPREYRLLVKLPGFRRDAITLSTRKRRILHVVADSWEPNGGHFERRISFGYDADLGQVRAEFDGEYLHVIIPRRQFNVNFWSL